MPKQANCLPAESIRQYNDDGNLLCISMDNAPQEQDDDPPSEVVHFCHITMMSLFEDDQVMSENQESSQRHSLDTTLPTPTAKRSSLTVETPPQIPARYQAPLRETTNTLQNSHLTPIHVTPVHHLTPPVTPAEGTYQCKNVMSKMGHTLASIFGNDDPAVIELDKVRCSIKKTKASKVQRDWYSSLEEQMTTRILKEHTQASKAIKNWEIDFIAHHEAFPTVSDMTSEIREKQKIKKRTEQLLISWNVTL